MFESKPYFSPNSWSKTWRLPTPTLPVAVHVSQGQKKSCLPQPMEAETDNFWAINNINMMVNIIHIAMVVGTILIKSPSVGGFNPPL